MVSPLVTKYACYADTFDSPSPPTLQPHQFVKAMCYVLLGAYIPLVTTARDAWIQADKNRYGGIHVCAIWKAFASRGLGVKASGFVDDFTVPESCSGGGNSTT
jgi:extracellular elastinolytic metalloproteinase